MKNVICFLTLISYVVALPPKVDVTNLVPNNIYLEPINPVNERQLPQGRIIGGNEVAPNSVPYQAAIIINGASFCGGSLISTNRVLTAAHCTVNAAFVEVRLGAHNQGNDEPTQFRISSTSIVNHENYNQGGFVANDVAVILLSSNVPLTDAIKTIALAPANAPAYEGSRALLSGWGRTSDLSSAISPVLKSVDLNIISNAACANSYGNNILTSSLCTSGSGRVGACNGDSGGPLVVDGTQVGVVSFGSAFCSAGNPTVFARLSSFRNWISLNAGV